MKTVDARGLACPQPVINTRKALSETDQVTVIVDNATARENVQRMAESRGYDVSVQEQSDGIYLYVSPSGQPLLEAAPAVEATLPVTGPTVLLIASSTFGRGPEELGNILMRGLLHTLNEVEPRPDKLIFVNTGVQLVVAGSPVLEDLQMLAQQGVEILACGTCLGYFDLKEKVAIGTVSNMYDIAAALLGAGKVIAV
jgi:selenium metabolism protein YedF